MKISVIGLGYIGLPTAAVLASRQNEVIGVDVSQRVVNTINQGRVHIVEPDLDSLVRATVRSGHLRATSIPEKSEAFLIAVPTPFKNDHEPDLSYVKQAVEAIAPVLEKGNVVILESTSPVGATERMIKWLREERPDLVFPLLGEDGSNADISVAYCPERVLPGHVVRELVGNNRIIGGVTEYCAERARGVYELFVEAKCLITDCRTAELSKLAENSFRDVNIAFANELSLICDRLGINVWKMIELANLHPRVNILQPGPGVGGHCIAVDPWFIVNSAPSEARLIRMARLVNDEKPYFVLKKINQAAASTGKGSSELVVSSLGLAFKPDIDDLRESPALVIAQQIGLMGFAKHFIVEPNISELPNGFEDGVSELVELHEALQISDIVVLLVDHSSFKMLDLSLLSGKQVVDTRGILSL